MRGVHPPSLKHLTKDKPIENTPLPNIVVIPLAQHNVGTRFISPAKPTVEPNTQVRVGTKIGELQGYMSANIHSTVSGVVKSIEPRIHPVGGNVLSVIVESDQKDEYEECMQPTDIELLTPYEIIDRVKSAGIVGLGGIALPTHLKLSPPKDKPIDVVILNGAECEPYLTGNYRLMIERTKEILMGGKLIMKTLGAKTGYIAIENNEPEAISKFKSIAPKFGFEVCVLHTKYPQGEERQLIYAISGREVSCGDSSFDVGAYVQNVGTAIAIYEACLTGKPLIERTVTVTGDVKEPKNLMVRIGTLFKDLIEYCGGYTTEPEKIIMGGPMMGIAQITDEVPVVKATSGILVQSKTSLPLDEPCIRCGSCIEACGMGLLPVKIADYVANRRFDEAKDFGVLDCTECGSCAWVCPSRRNLIHLFKYGKAKLQC